MIFVAASRNLRSALFWGFVLITASLVWAAPAQAIEQGGIGGRPAYPEQHNTRSQSIFVHTLRPNEQAKDGVQVINNTPETKRILVYAVDSQMSSGGSFACAQAIDKPISVGSWVSLGQKEITLNPGAKQVVDFTITTPKHIAPGEHNGCIVIQDTKPQSTRDGNGIVLSLRSAIRVAITVPGNIQKGLVFTGIGSEPKGAEKMLLSAALKNNGNVSLDTQLDVSLAYPFGLKVAQAGGNFPVLSDSEGRFNFESARPFWGGWYQLVAAAHYNDDPQASLGEGKATASIAQSTWIYVTPHPIAAVIEMLAAGVCIAVTVLLVRRRRQHKHALQRATTHTVAAHENLHTIAEQYAMPWKRLARLNKLQPPYQLKPGQTLTVTPPAKDQKPPQRP